jgi:tRNA(His) 5'-end guanylyltransferase
MSKYDKDSLGTRMKFYETMAAAKRLMPLLPVMVRLDGVAFHTFTKGLERPYDKRLSQLMIDTTKYLVKETNARIGYTQSDEITLLLYSDEWDSQIYFDAKLTKIVSILAAKASVFFNSMLPTCIPEKATSPAFFDCRVWNVPTQQEAYHVFLWREQDATRNSISMAAQSLYSHKQLQHKSGAEMQEMIFQKGINWNDYPRFFKRGTYIQRRTIEREFTPEEFEKLPPKHAARKNPYLKILRGTVVEVDMPPISQVINELGVLFYGAEPSVAGKVLN